MRADAARNLEAVLTTAARILAAEPGATIASIAVEAGVDRRTVYRRFASREELLAALHTARLEAIEAAIEDARLREAPVVIALHRYVENIIGVNRTWPVDLSLTPRAAAGTPASPRSMSSWSAPATRVCCGPAPWRAGRGCSCPIC